ncbi:cholesterol esterase [Trebonia kvetii]|uniref:Cholesterol esterase n=1 Tax=Trebonia kvetii TaxID=2480626 RepID=A0A6P2BXM2_9ACTN|nr:DUF6230 family protein [Trebonia kvetii]TVZ03824.1 cholesterol esterase [Trebonia kvetii]
MSVDKSSSSVRGKVKWRRFALVAVPAVVVAGTMVGLTAEGALASSISVSGQEFTITADQLTGTGFAQFGGALPSSSGGQTPVIVSAMQNATMTNLCQSVTVLGLTIHLTAGGGGGDPVSASNLVVDADSQTASSAVFNNISIGQDAGTMGGPAGTFGEQASSVTINKLVQKTWYTTAGTFTLPNLSLGFGGSC